MKLKLKVRTCDKKESVNSKCEKRLGKRNQEIMRTGLSARGSLIWSEEQGRDGPGVSRVERSWERERSVQGSRGAGWVGEAEEEKRKRKRDERSDDEGRDWRGLDWLGWVDWTVFAGPLLGCDRSRGR